MKEKAIPFTDPGYALAEQLTASESEESDTRLLVDGSGEYPEAIFVIRGFTLPGIPEQRSVRTVSVCFAGHSANGDEEIVGIFDATGRPIRDTVRYSRFPTPAEL